MTHWARTIRRAVCRPLFDYCGDNVNVEKGAYFATGGGISIGSGSGLGVNCLVHGPLEIGNKVMMGPDVVILTHTHNITVRIFPWVTKGQEWQNLLLVMTCGLVCVPSSCQE